MKKILGLLAISLVFPVLLTGCGGGGGNPLAGGFLALQVSAGDFHTCAVQSSGQVECWGANGAGQLGNGTQVGSSTPVQVENIINAAEVSAGGAHSCALLNDGTVDCWGDDSFGQLGNNSLAPAPVPVQVADLPNPAINPAMAISAGENHTCAVLSDGTIRCWGDNSFGQLGNGTQTTSLTPVQVSGITGATPATTATAVSAGGDHTCALLADNTIKCWGLNTSGQLGDAPMPVFTPPSNESTPFPVTGLSNIISVAAGAAHTCAVRSDGTVWCWGDDSGGQIGQIWPSLGALLGINSISFSALPLKVGGVSNAEGITAGLNHSCASIAGGGVQCWGDDTFGQLGNGGFSTTNAGFFVPLVSVINLSTVTQVDAGADHTCAHLSDDVIACWGDNFYGQLGSGNFLNSSVPLGVVD